MKFFVKLQLRPYQEEALKFALDHGNSIICLPTGTGKTLIACAWACELLNERVAKGIIVIEPSRLLVEQISRYFVEKTNIPEHYIAGIHGGMHKHERKEKWEKSKIIVCTAHVALNDYEFWKDRFNVLIADECHHTVGLHAYNKLLKNYGEYFEYKLGLTATISRQIKGELEKKYGKIYALSYTDPKIRDYVPEWYGEVLDAEFSDIERDLYNKLYEIRKTGGWGIAGVAALAMRYLARDGALALMETYHRALKRNGLIGIIIEDALRSIRKKYGEDAINTLCYNLHKLEAFESTLLSHEFEKAIVFVDRVCVAKFLEQRYKEYNPVTFLGRMHGGKLAQKEALERAKEKGTKLIISTSAGEEGVDLPEADLLIIWSNVTNPIRFIQRLGRIMRKTKEKLKFVTFIATPSTRDYDALYDGLYRVCIEPIARFELSFDLEYLKQIVPKTESYKLVEFIAGSPKLLSELKFAFPRDYSSWIEKHINCGEISFIYGVDSNEWEALLMLLAIDILEIVGSAREFILDLLRTFNLAFNILTKTIIEKFLHQRKLYYAVADYNTLRKDFSIYLCDEEFKWNSLIAKISHKRRKIKEIPFNTASVNSFSRELSNFVEKSQKIMLEIRPAVTLHSNFGEIKGYRNLTLRYKYIPTLDKNLIAVSYTHLTLPTN